MGEARREIVAWGGSSEDEEGWEGRVGSGVAQGMGGSVVSHFTSCSGTSLEVGAGRSRLRPAAAGHWCPSGLPDPSSSYRSCPQHPSHFSKTRKSQLPPLQNGGGNPKPPNTSNSAFTSHGARSRLVPLELQDPVFRQGRPWGEARAP